MARPLKATVGALKNATKRQRVLAQALGHASLVRLEALLPLDIIGKSSKRESCTVNTQSVLWSVSSYGAGASPCCSRWLEVDMR